MSVLKNLILFEIPVDFDNDLLDLKYNYTTFKKLDMKLIAKTLCLVLFVITLNSCNKDSSAPTKMSCTINGTTWTPDARLTVLSGGYFTITATTASLSQSASLVIVIHGTTIGTYTFNPLQAQTQCEVTYTPSLLSPTDTYLGATGSVKLTKVDQTSKLISGTFQFVLTNGTIISQGLFNDLQYQQN